MFTCNNINLLTFTYYLKYILAINMTIVPFIYFYLNLINLIKNKKKLNKWYIKRRIKPIFYIIILFTLSLILHNTLNTSNNICYLSATPKIYHEYKNSYNFLQNKDIDSELKNNYLNNILTNKSNNTLTSTVYKQANIIKVNEEKNSIVEEPKVIVEDNFLNETDTNIQNNVYIINGTFNYPKYVYGNTNTYSGMFCPSDPLNNGYNNPYGYNNYFYTRLTRFIEEARNNGYLITISSQGCRTYDTQINYYNTMTPGRAASPGLSLHGFGIASDLEFYNQDGSICSYFRTDSSCPSMGWAHQNAEKFGLTFPLLYSNYKEDWHIEPLNKSKY
ncbi:MAG: M15 family metallopeptidase [Bacilli bacterium]|nr:M15 family metallopeptidase [Bacilli bacterium]